MQARQSNFPWIRSYKIDLIWKETLTRNLTTCCYVIIMCNQMLNNGLLHISLVLLYLSSIRFCPVVTFISVASNGSVWYRNCVEVKTQPLSTSNTSKLNANVLQSLLKPTLQQESILVGSVLPTCQTIRALVTSTRCQYRGERSSGELFCTGIQWWPPDVTSRAGGQG